MTELAAEAKVTRKVMFGNRGQRLVVTLHARYVEVRPYRARKGYAITYDTLFHTAVLVAVEKRRGEKLAAKKRR